MFDIECLLVPVNKHRSKQKIISSHHLLSIAAVSFINKRYEQHFNVIEDMSQEAEEDIVEKFVDFIIEQLEKFEIPECISQLINELEDELEHVVN